MYPSRTISAWAGTSRSTVTAGTSSTGSPRRKPAIMNSSRCFGSGALAEYAVIGSSPSATATGRRPPGGGRGDRSGPGRAGHGNAAARREPVGAAVLVDLPVHERRPLVDHL